LQRVLLSIITLLSVAAVAEESKPYKIDVVRDSRTYHQVAAPFWSSEYPQPVINIHASTKGETTIQGFESLRKKTERKSCTVRNSLYHPWAKEPNSVINYYTINPLESYEVTQELPAAIMENFAPKRPQNGDQILNVVYTAEGYAQGIYHPKNGKESLIDFPADIFEQNKGYFSPVETSEPLPKKEQWLYLKCAQGYNVFVEDTDLLSQQGITQGSITGYGDISPDSATVPE